MGAPAADTTIVHGAPARARTARLAGLTREQAASLEGIDARRSQLRQVTSIVTGGLATCLVLAVGSGSAGVLPPGWAPRVGFLLVVGAFLAYVAEKERNLRALAHMLIDERQRADALAEVANHDPLTGLLTRAAFEVRLAEALETSKQHQSAFALIMVDLDRFRELNQRHGASTCDRALVDVAHRLQANLRHGDAVARLRGDQFGVVLADPDAGVTAPVVAGRLLDALQQPLSDLGGLRIRASVGVVIHRGGRKDQASDLLRDAELARTLAKRRGGGRLEVWDRSGPAPAPAPSAAG